MFLREGMNELGKYSMIASSINSTHKVQGSKQDRMGGDQCKIAFWRACYCETEYTWTVRTHPLLEGQAVFCPFTPNLIGDSTGTVWDA